MSEIRERFIKTMESMQYDIDKEIFKRDTKDILQEITQKYIEIYGIDDLTEKDKECIQLLLGTKI